MILFLVSWRPSSQRASRTKWPSIPASENSRARAMATDLPKPRLAPVITQQVREPEGNIFLFSEMQKGTGVPKTLLGSRAGRSSRAKDARIATPNSRVLRSSLEMENLGAIHSTNITGNFGPKLNGSVRSNRKSFEKMGPPFEVDHFSRSDRLEFWLNGSRPLFYTLSHLSRLFPYPYNNPKLSKLKGCIAIHT